MNQFEIVSSNSFTVSKALHVLSGTNMALKRLCSSSSLADLESLLQLRHENIVDHIALVSDLTRNYLAMEWLSETDWVTLRSWLDLNSCDFKKGLEISEQILSGLEYLHSLFYSHGDLRPEHLMIEKTSGNVKIFGFNILTGKNNPRKFGHFAYLSPELVEIAIKRNSFEPIKNFDLLAGDIFAYGMTVHEILYGYVPFDRNRVDLSHVKNPGLIKFLAHAMSYDPLRRANAKELFTIFPDFQGQKKATADGASLDILFGVSLDFFNFPILQKYPTSESRVKLRKLVLKYVNEFGVKDLDICVLTDFEDFLITKVGWTAEKIASIKASVRTNVEPDFAPVFTPQSFSPSWPISRGSLSPGVHRPAGEFIPLMDAEGFLASADSKQHSNMISGAGISKLQSLMMNDELRSITHPSPVRSVNSSKSSHKEGSMKLEMV
jgi:serine/threonine protein kinase